MKPYLLARSFKSTNSFAVVFMTRNRDNMSFADMAWVCGRAGAAIVGSMLLLGVLMIAQKPEVTLELEATGPISLIGPAVAGEVELAADETAEIASQ